LYACNVVPLESLYAAAQLCSRVSPCTYRVYIKRAAKKIGLKKRIGWHPLRHTFGTILNANGENPKVIQELLRHATLKVTMDTYVQAVSDEKRNAQSKVVKMLLPGIRRAVI
jgi:integrase